MDESNLVDNSRDSPLGGRGHKDVFSNIVSSADLASCELSVPVFSLRSSERLPHLFPAADLDQLFPRYEVPPEDPFVTGGPDIEQARRSMSSGSRFGSPLGEKCDIRGEPILSGVYCICDAAISEVDRRRS